MNEIVESFCIVDGNIFWGYDLVELYYRIIKRKNRNERGGVFFRLFLYVLKKEFRRG